ncbi:unnamed protein product [Moneuplotes crassus]|uniref:TRP C-terminal domain-containing protein n=1 Tax=Euplotes crassus TaxID=5936 RepID=A0AAD2D6U6_EUPCR|nr:unnamed protein product [Moneuplotes crassus]
MEIQKILFFSFLVGLACTRSCTDPAAISQATSSSSFTNAIFTNGVIGTVLDLGPTSGDLYLFGMAQDPSNNYTFAKRVKQDGTETYSKYYSSNSPIYPFRFLFMVDAQETYFYFGEYSQPLLTFIETACSTGAINRILSVKDISTNNDNIRISPMASGGGFIFTATENGLGHKILCKFPGGTSALQCTHIPLDYIPNFSIAIDANSVYYGMEGSTDENVYYHKSDFSLSNPHVWAKKIACPGSGCVGQGAVAKHDQSRSYLYTLYVYNSVAIFTILNSGDGSSFGAQYIDNDSCTAAYDITYSSDQVFILTSCSTEKLSVYNLTSGTMISFRNTGSINFGGAVVASSYLYLLGFDDSATAKGYWIKTLHKTPASNSDIVSGSTFSVAAFDYLLDTFTPNTSTFVNVGSISDSGAVGNTDVSLPFVSTTSGNIAIYLDTLTYSNLAANTQYILNIYLTCYISTLISITYVLDDGSGGSPLTWVTLDSTAQTLTMNTPNVTTTTSYNVYIQSTVGGSTYSRQVVISVDPESSSGSSTSSSSQVSADDTKLQPDSFSQSAEITTVTMVGATAGVATISTVALQGGPQGLWSIIHQFQFYLLIPLLSSTVPDKITEFLEGMDFCLFNLDFISFDSFPVFVEAEKLMECKSESGYLYDIGIRYQCLFLSMFQFFMSLLLAMIVHVVIIILYIKFGKYESKLSWPIRYLFKLLTLNFYIRYLVEAFLILNLASSNEVYLSDFSSTGKVLSYCLSLVIVILLAFTMVLAYIISRRAAQDKINLETTYFSEIVDGTKETFWARFATFFHLLRIFCSVTWIVMSVSFGAVARATVYCLIQFAFVCIKVAIRFYEEPKDNIIEVLDDLIYLGLCIVIVVQANEDNWNESLSNIVITVMTLNTLLILVINIFVMVVTLLSYCKTKQRARISQDTTIQDKNKRVRSSSSKIDDTPRKSKISKPGTAINVFEEEKYEGTSRNYASDLTPNEINISE